jgi:hypothetical protein
MVFGKHTAEKNCSLHTQDTKKSKRTRRESHNLLQRHGPNNINLPLDPTSLIFYHFSIVLTWIPSPHGLLGNIPDPEGSRALEINDLK